MAESRSSLPDVKSLPSTFGAGSAGGSLSLGGGIGGISPAGVGSTLGFDIPAPKLEMYKQLRLREDQIKFLESPNKEKLLARFEIGPEKLIMHGGVFRMSIHSELVESIMTLDPPYILAANMTVYGGALTVLWLYLNGFDEMVDTQQRLSLKGFLNLYDLLNYFGVKDPPNAGGIVDNWYIYFAGRIATTPENELLEHGDAIVAVLNKVAVGTALTQEASSDRMADRLRKIDKIASRLTNIPIIGYEEDRNGIIKSKLYGWIDRKAADNTESFLRFMKDELGKVPNNEGDFLEIGMSPHLLGEIPIRHPNAILLYAPSESFLEEYGHLIERDLNLYGHMQVPRAPYTSPIVLPPGLSPPGEREYAPVYTAPSPKHS